MFAQVSAQPVDAGAFAAAGKGGVGVHRPASKIAVAPLANRTKPFEDQAKRVEAGVATGTALVCTVPGQRLAQSEIAQLCLVVRQLGNSRWGWRNPFAE